MHLCGLLVMPSSQIVWSFIIIVMTIVMIMKVYHCIKNRNLSIYRLDIVDTKKVISLRGDDENDSDYF